MSDRVCPECDQPMLPKGQRRKNPSDYRHASGCPKAPPSIHCDAQRAIRHEKRRENMSPAEKERFDTSVRPWSDLANARKGRPR